MMAPLADWKLTHCDLLVCGSGEVLNDLLGSRDGGSSYRVASGALIGVGSQCGESNKSATLGNTARTGSSQKTGLEHMLSAQIFYPQWLSQLIGNLHRRGRAE